MSVAAGGETVFAGWLALVCQGPCGSVVEHSLGKGEVARSIRAMGTINFYFGILFWSAKDGKRQI